MPGRYVLALDEGSSSTRAVLVDEQGVSVGEARADVTWNRRRPGWAELDPVGLWAIQQDTIDRVLASTGIAPRDIAAIGVTSHRETVMVWDRNSGRPVHDALVWISNQTDDIVRRWTAAGFDDEFRTRTGLRNDSFFSAAKIAWLLEEVPGVREGAECGRLVAGTVDSWLVWNLTAGRSHLTDHSCASRTALFNLERLAWDFELCAMLGIPVELLPPALASDSEFGTVASSVLDPGDGREIPIRGVVADQQAGMFGQACFGDGSAKNTFGTAGVLTVNSGDQVRLVDGLTSSVGWTVQGRTCYELEGVAFHSGQTLHWLRENLGLIGPHESIDDLVASVPDNGGVYLVPAMGGLCAPYWDRAARASVVGLSLDSTRGHIVRAALEAMAYQANDSLVRLHEQGQPVTTLKVDGGAARNDVLCQFLADISGLTIERPAGLERTALGVAYIAGIGEGLWSGPVDVLRGWTLDRTFSPSMSDERRTELYDGWRAAVDRTLTTTTSSSAADAALATSGRLSR